MSRVSSLKKIDLVKEIFQKVKEKQILELDSEETEFLHSSTGEIKFRKTKFIY